MSENNQKINSESGRNWKFFIPFYGPYAVYKSDLESKANMKFNFYISLIIGLVSLFWGMGCASVEEKASRNALTNACPNVGILEESAINPKAVFEDKTYLILVAVQSKQGSRCISTNIFFPQNQFQTNAITLNLDDFQGR